MSNNLTLRTLTSPYGDNTKGSVLSQGELDSNFIYLKGEVIYSAETINGAVNLKKYNGNDISFDTNGAGNMWHIPSGSTVTVKTDFQDFIYGDLYIEGQLQLDLNSQLVVLNGNIYVSGGTITGPGTIYLIDLPTFDTYVTGGTYISSATTMTFTNNAGTSFSVTGVTTSGVTYWTSGSAGVYSLKAFNNSSIDATGDYALAEGYSTTAQGDYSHSEGETTIAIGYGSHSEGMLTTANGVAAHAEGNNTKATGDYSHAEGSSTSAIGPASHAEGLNTVASGYTSHAEGQNTTASGNTSHAEGYYTIASRAYSHAEGWGYTAIGITSHAEGYISIASGR